MPDDLPWEQTGRTNRLPMAQWSGWGVTDRDGTPLKDHGVPAGVVLPMGRKGPAFLAYPNYDVYLEWNQSFVYTLTAAHLADRLAGSPAYDPRNPDPALSVDEMKALQTLLQAAATMSARSTASSAPAPARRCARSRCGSACRSTAGRPRSCWPSWGRRPRPRRPIATGSNPSGCAAACLRAARTFTLASERAQLEPFRRSGAGRRVVGQFEIQPFCLQRSVRGFAARNSTLSLLPG